MKTTKNLDKIVYKAIALPLLISLAVTTIVFLNDFHWTIYIPIIGATLIGCIFEINKHYLIQLDKKDNDSLNLIYYNYLDKIVCEEINPDKLSEYKVSKVNKLTTIRFLNNRELKLHHLKGVNK